MKLKISPFAKNDLTESIKYYNKQRENLGGNFAEIDSETFKRIKDNPYQFQKEYKEMRKAKTERFPFKIFFVVNNSNGYILGIFHSSRNPEIIQKRYRKQ